MDHQQVGGLGGPQHQQGMQHQVNDPRRMRGQTQQFITGHQGPQVGPGLQGQHQPPYTHPQQGTQLQYNSQQQFHQHQQPNQAMGRGMRQQGPMGPGLGQGPYNPMFQSNAMPGNKQRPTTLDLHSTSPRLNQPNHNNNPHLQPQQQQSSGMLGSLFASGKKILEEATTPLGARGPFAHPSQTHPTLGHHPVGPQAGQSYGLQPGPYGQGPPGQQQMGQQQGGTILNTMKNIFKL